MEWTWANGLFFGMMVSFLSGVIGAFIFSKRGSLANRIAHVGAFFGSLLAIGLSIVVFGGESPFNLTLWTVTLDYELSFTFDSLTAFFLFIIGIVAMIVSIYSVGYVSQYDSKQSVALLGSGFNMFLLSMVAVVAADNILTFLIAWETMSLVSFLLVMTEHERPSVRRTGFIYVTMTHLGTGFIILAFFILSIVTGSIDFADFQIMSYPIGVQHVIFIFSLIGFGTKAGIVPLHIWLPRAHPEAPSHVSALMSAVMIKTALYGFIRVMFHFLDARVVWWGIAVMAIGIVSALIGILYGAVQKDMKRLLAFSSVENGGLIFIGLGASLILSALDQPAFAGLALLAALYHTLNHALFKSVLFMGSGAVMQQTGTKNMEQLGGLLRKMPQTALFFLVGALAISSLPPFNGFVSKWLTFQSLLHLSLGTNVGFVGIFAVVVLAFISAAVALAFVKLFATVFLAQPRSASVESAQEAPLSMRFAMGLAAVGIVSTGVFPGFISTGLGRVTGTYFPVSSMSKEMFLHVPNLHLPIFQVVLALLAAFGIVWLSLILFAGRNRHETVDTWACGIDLQPTMSYSGTSFSHPLLVIFKFLLPVKERARMEEQGYHFSITLKHVFERWLYDPVIQAVVGISKLVRRIQDGSIHTYLAFIFVVLIALLLVT